MKLLGNVLIINGCNHALRQYMQWGASADSERYLRVQTLHAVASQEGQETELRSLAVLSSDPQMLQSAILYWQGGASNNMTE